MDSIILELCEGQLSVELSHQQYTQCSTLVDFMVDRTFMTDNDGTIPVMCEISNPNETIDHLMSLLDIAKFARGIKLTFDILVDVIQLCDYLGFSVPDIQIKLALVSNMRRASGWSWNNLVTFIRYRPEIDYMAIFSGETHLSFDLLRHLIIGDWIVDGQAICGQSAIPIILDLLAQL